MIFKEFQRLNTGPNTCHGIGLGLSIVERIGRMLDHPIHLSSHPGAGSVFGITLPISPEAAAERAGDLPSAPPWSQLDGCVVLCVDNEPAILDGMRSLLENWHCKVLQASDAAEALRADGRSGRQRQISCWWIIIWKPRPASTASQRSAPRRAMIFPPY